MVSVVGVLSPTGGKDSPNDEKTPPSPTYTPLENDSPNSSRSSSSASMGPPPTQTSECDDVAPAPDQEHPPERRFSQTLMEELSSQLSTPTSVHEASTSAAEPSVIDSPRPASPPVTLPRALREIAALSSLPSYAQPLLEMGFSRRHVIQAMMATGSRETASARRINILVTWLLEHPVSDDGVCIKRFLTAVKANKFTCKVIFSANNTMSVNMYWFDAYWLLFFLTVIVNSKFLFHFSTAQLIISSWKLCNIS